MRICFFLPIFPPMYGGGTIQAIKLAKELRKKGADIFFITLTNDLSKKGPGIFEDFEVFYIYIKNLTTYIEGHTPRFDKFSLIIKIFTAFIRFRKRYSIIHIQGMSYPFTLLSILAKLLRKKTIVKVTMLQEVDFRYCGRTFGRISKFSAKRLDKIITISSIIQKRLINKDFDKSKIMFIPNGVDIQKYTPLPPDQKEVLKTQMNIAEKTVITFVGGITYRKGIDRLISIWPAIAERFRESCLILIGPRSEDEGIAGDEFCYKEIRQTIKKTGMENIIHFTGRVDNVVEYLQISDLFVFPSTMEGMPNVILETMACGVPAVSYRVSGVDDIIANGENGRIIEIGNESSFKKAVIETLQDKKKRNNYSLQARKRIVEKFSLDYVSGQYLKIYDSLIER